jgi:hypothetical protein
MSGYWFRDVTGKRLDLVGGEYGRRRDLVLGRDDGNMSLPKIQIF